MKSPKFKSVEEYLASQDPAKARTLRSVIDLILTQFPELESLKSSNEALQPTPKVFASRRAGGRIKKADG